MAQRIRKRNACLSECAILLRTNSLCSDYAEVLTREGIPFRCVERLENIYESSIARDILDYLKLAKGSKLSSTMFRVMNRPYRFISRESIPDNELDFKKMKAYHRQDPAVLKRIERFERDLKQLGKMKPYGAVHYILYGMGYLKYLKSQASKSGCDADGNIQKALEIKERAKEILHISYICNDNNGELRPSRFLKSLQDIQ